MASKEHNFNLNRLGSKLASLYNPLEHGKVAYVYNGAVTTAPTDDDATKLTGIVFGIGRGYAGGDGSWGTNAGTAHTGAPWYDPQAGYVGSDDGGEGGVAANPYNQLGDPNEKNYKLTASDLVDSAGASKHGSAQKFVLALLDSAYVAYNSGVTQGSGLTSMTVTRGDLTLTNSNVTGISGAVNTYSRSYSVTFNYKQSGMITAGGLAALPDITNDLASESGDGPF